MGSGPRATSKHARTSLQGPSGSEIKGRVRGRGRCCLQSWTIRVLKTYQLQVQKIKKNTWTILLILLSITGFQTMLYFCAKLRVVGRAGADVVSPSFVCSVTQSCWTLCDPLDHSLPGSSVHRILQAKILEWVAISTSRGSS